MMCTNLDSPSDAQNMPRMPPYIYAARFPCFVDSAGKSCLGTLNLAYSRSSVRQMSDAEKLARQRRHLRTSCPRA
eukprot:1898947-Pyramimonas_sp.AAC.1